MSKDIKIGNGLFRVEINNLTLLYDKETNVFNLGFKNADILTEQDLIDLNEATTLLLKYIEDEKH